MLPCSLSEPFGGYVERFWGRNLYLYDTTLQQKKQVFLPEKENFFIYLQLIN